MKIVENHCLGCNKQIYKAFIQKDESVWVEKGMFNKIRRVSSDRYSIVCPHCLVEHEAEYAKAEEDGTNLTFKTC